MSHTPSQTIATRTQILSAHLRDLEGNTAAAGQKQQLELVAEQAVPRAKVLFAYQSF
jgi:hypothetical protein